MVGAKAGQVVVVIGPGDGRLAAELARVTGLNGRTIVGGADLGAEAVVDAAAARAGALVEFEPGDPTRLPNPSGEADVVVLHRVLGPDAHRRDAIAHEAVRLLRPGGRLIVIEGAAPGSRRTFGRHGSTAALDGRAAQRVLETTGLRATRVLAEVDGVTYVEGVRQVRQVR